MTEMLTGAAPTTNQGQAAATTPAQTPATEPAKTEAQAAPKQDAEAGKQQNSEAPKAQDYTLKGEYDANVLSTYTDLAKSMGLNQEGAQKMLDQMAPALKKAEETKLTNLRAEWLEQSKNDPEFGGAKLDESLKLANKAYEALASPTLKELLKDSGLANHPEMVRLFRKAGEMISTDHFVGGKSTASQKPTGPRDFNTIAESFYSTK
jgi:hypothetical protein